MLTGQDFIENRQQQQKILLIPTYDWLVKHLRRGLVLFDKVAVLYSVAKSIFTRGSQLKSDWVTFGLVLSSSWADFAVKTWQPWSCIAILQ